MFFGEIEEFFCIDICRDAFPDFSFSEHLDKCSLSGEHLIFSELILPCSDPIEEALSLLTKYELRIANNPLTRDTSIVYRVPLDHLGRVAIVRIYTESTERIEFSVKIQLRRLVWVLYLSTKIINIDISSSPQWRDDFFPTESTYTIARCEFGYELLEYLSRDEYFPISIELFTDFFDLIGRHFCSINVPIL